MTIGVLAEMAGLVGKIDEEALRSLLTSRDTDVEPALFEALRTTALQFVRAGGSWAAQEWAGMSRLERLAAAAAGEILYRTRTVSMARAGADVAAAAAMLAPVDGGRAYEEEALRRLHESGLRSERKA